VLSDESVVFAATASYVPRTSS